MYNSVPSDDSLKDLSDTINNEISEDDLVIVDMIDSDLIKEAINKMKIGKSDCEYNFGSDVFVNASDVLSSSISFLFKTFLIHGFIPIFLLMCSLIFLVKDKLRKISNSDNYRAIAISSLLLKILDWVILILFNENLKTCDLQFGFQEESSTTMCSWLVSEVISYYMRNKSSVFSCLLDLKKSKTKLNLPNYFKN